MMVGHHSRVEDLELIPETLDHDKSVNEVLSVGSGNQDQTGRFWGRDRPRVAGNHRRAMEVEVDFSNHTSYGTKQEIGRHRSLNVRLRVAD